MITEMCITLVCMATIAAAAVCGFSQKLLVREYAISSGKVNNEITIAHLSDLHETSYGEKQEQLIRALDEMAPDLVLMTGDMADGYREEAPLRQLIDGIADRYPCYYTTGNHEAWTGKPEEYKDYFRQQGVTVLQGGGDRLPVEGTLIDIFGVDDPDACDAGEWQAQLLACREAVQPDTFSILLSHRPERIAEYTGFDLVLSGHAHGGQVRIPFVLNGIYAPDQGWFPKYGGGLYETGGGDMIVSRGLQINEIPRIFNRPELVKIVVTPE